jgi:hypothetical protein
MSYIDEKAPRSVTEPFVGIQGLVPAGVEASAAPISSDRLYRLAAMTAGIFFLATLL